ncbi:exo-alpha-sialidase [Actinophytocola sp.]|uniref:exo-alpha-sialidase n=1 Tax=Actinophytocola sp. TaxID=1872138 RepID=UPI003899ADC4
MGSVRSNGFRPVGVDGAYAAFPSVCRFASGQLRLVWRQGSDHVNARDGRVYTATSTDNGRTWSAATVAVTDAAGIDLRDPCVSTAGGTTWLTYFKGTSALAAAGCFLRISTDDGVTWGSEVRIDGQPYAAISAPVIQVGTNLLATFYGRASGDTFDSSWLATSTDGGATWTSARVANGQADGRHYQEPWLVARSTEVWMFFRYGNQVAIGASVSTNSGSSWSAPTQLFDDATGRPAAAWLSTGTMAVVARRISDKQAVVRSRNAGAAQTAWLPPRPTMVQPASGPVGMTYAHPLEIPGGVICPLGIETSTSVSRIHIGWLADDGGVSLLGDLIPDDRTAVATDVDQLLFAEGFSQANGVLRAPWVVGAGGVQASNGCAVSTAVDNVPDLAWVDLATADADVEADFWYTGQAGFGIIGRVVSANTYLLLTVETGGTALRIYKVVSGTATQLAVVTGTTMRDSAWGRLRMFLRGNTIQGYLNGWPLVGYELSGTDATTFAGQARHGIKLNPAGTGVHRCRRFVAKS